MVWNLIDGRIHSIILDAYFFIPAYLNRVSRARHRARRFVGARIYTSGQWRIADQRVWNSWGPRGLLYAALRDVKMRGIDIRC